MSLEDVSHLIEAGESEARRYSSVSCISSRKYVFTGCVRPCAVITGQLPKYLENKAESTVADLVKENKADARGYPKLVNHHK